MRHTRAITCLLGLFGGIASAADPNIYPATGAVGLGTSTPAATTHLHVKSTANVTDGGLVRIETPDYTYANQIDFFDAGGARGFLGFRGVNATAPWNAIGMYLINKDNSNLILGTNGTERVRVDLNGNVGIGSTSPLARLHVVGQVANEVARFQARTDASNNRSFISLMNTNPSYWWEFSAQDSSGGALVNGLAIRERSGSGASLERMYIAPGGNVGIGTQSPSALLHVNGNLMIAGKNVGGSAHFGPGSVNISNTNNGISVEETNTAVPVAIGVGYTTGSAGLLWAGTYGALYTMGNATPLIYTASVHEFTNGNVGIGGVPGQKLDVIGATNTDVISRVLGQGTGRPFFQLTAAGGTAELAASANGDLVVNANGVASNVATVYRAGAVMNTLVLQNGNVGVGAAPVAGLGALQLASGTTRAAGLALGSDMSLYRYNTGSLAIDTGGGDVTMALQRGAARTYLAATAGGGYLVTDSAVPLTFRTANTDRMTIDSGGKVGIGTASPANVFHLASSTNAGGRFDISTVNGATGAANLILANSNTTVGNASGIEFINGGGGPTAFISAINYNHNINGSTTGGLDFSVYNAGTLSHALVITPSGNVGIGTTPTTSALAVNGIISAKEIKVVANPADYVFADGYRLLPLAEVEAFIAAHKHLPGVPSAKEQEENGEMVADLMRAHLEKIEELNLYVIQQQKHIDDLVAQQKARDQAFVEVLSRLAALESKSVSVK